jgi:ribulose-5-phosphate 4-epimerase/fuculose-1-phosphate aldolase
MYEEGVLKYSYDWQESEFVTHSFVPALLSVRAELYEKGLIGVTEDGVGYGNVSHRIGDTEEFVITGTQTGAYPELTEAHLTTVTSFDIDKNRLTCTGPVVASSESLTHAAVYQKCANVQAVLHVHSLSLWKALMYIEPTTSAEIPYGTPEVARAVQDVSQASTGLIVMGGHYGGLLIYGSTLEAAVGSLGESLQQVSSSTS